MNKFHAQETTNDYVEEESTGVELMLPHKIRHEKTSDIEKIIKPKEKFGIETGYSYEPKALPKISINEIKRLNREITRRIPPKEVELLFNEHNFLVQKKFSEGISEKEEKRLKLIRWELDRIEDAFHGENIDRLESFLEGYERFAKDINEFIDNIRHSNKSKGHK
jgi:hypothetical protein